MCILEVSTSRCTEHLVWEVNLGWVTEILVNCMFVSSLSLATISRITGPLSYCYKSVCRVVHYRIGRRHLPCDHFDGSVCDFHTSLAFQLWLSCSTLARVSVSPVGDASSGLTVSQLKVSVPVVWRFAALILQRKQYQTVLTMFFF